MQGLGLSRRVVAEALGTALLVATVVGSGITAETLTKDVALALLGNTLPTGAILVVLITILRPISGAHFNPVVTLVFAAKCELPARDAALYFGAQFSAASSARVHSQTPSPDPARRSSRLHFRRAHSSAWHSWHGCCAETMTNPR